MSAARYWKCFGITLYSIVTVERVVIHSTSCYPPSDACLRHMRHPVVWAGLFFSLVVKSHTERKRSAAASVSFSLVPHLLEVLIIHRQQESTHHSTAPVLIMPIAIVSNHSEDLALSPLNTVDNSTSVKTVEALLVVSFDKTTDFKKQFPVIP
jgi:hypothetical protein